MHAKTRTNSLLQLILIFLSVALCSNAFSQVTFPLRTSDNKRYLQDQHGKPFPILGRTAWCIISQPVSGQQTFIQHTKSFGYNSIEMAAICHWRMGNHTPFNGNNDLPFLKKLDGTVWKDSLNYDAGLQSPDFTTPNEAYWKYMDTFIAYCEKNEILVFLFPAYVGYHNGDQGWMNELVANGPQKIKTYGSWFAERYKNSKNIVWMLLGDDGIFLPEQRAAEAALIEGLKSVPNQQSVYYSAESFSGQNSADNKDFGHEMSLNGIYNWERNIPAQARLAYAHDPVIPAYLLEEPYDEEGPDGNNYNPNAIQPVRRFQWWAWLSSMAGYMAGNGYIWPFIDPVWQQHLNTQGANDMKRLNAFIRSVTWWQLIPSGLNGMKTLVTDENNIDTTSIYVAAASTKDGSLLIAYIPPAHTGSITVDMTALNNKAYAYWFDPTNAHYSVITGSPLHNTGEHNFTTPGKNSSGDNDWVLVLSVDKR